jgi:serine phosphatase RsbU (regulator of sigma subunit)
MLSSGREISDDCRIDDEGLFMLIYTDGVVEARNRDDEEFGLARLIEVCRTGSAALSRRPPILERDPGWRSALVATVA